MKLRSNKVVNLRDKFCVSIILTTLIALLVFCGVNLYTSYKTLGSLVKFHYDTVQEEAANNLNNIISSTLNKHSLISSRLQLRKSIAALSIHPLDLANMSERDNHILNIQNISNATLASVDHLTKIVISDIEGKIIFQTKGSQFDPALIKNLNYTNDPQLTMTVPHDKQPVLTSYSLLTLDGQVIGKLASMYSTDPIKKVLDLYAKIEGAEVFREVRVNRNGLFIKLLSPNLNDTNSFIEEANEFVNQNSTLVAAFEDSKSGFIEYERSDGKIFLAGFKQLDIPNWTFIYRAEKKAAFELFNNQLLLAIAMVVFIFIIIFVITNRFTFKLLTPLEELTVTALKIAGGELTARSKVSTTDEVGQLAESFNTMADILTIKIEDFKKEQTTILESIWEGIILFDEKGDIEHCNEAALTLFGYTNEELNGKPFTTLLDKRSSGEWQDRINEFIKSEKTNIHEERTNILGLKKSGEPFHSYFSMSKYHDNEGIKFVGIFRDVSSQVEYFEELKAAAFFDGLTGLPSRKLFKQNVELAISRATRNNTKFALFFIDLNNFKPINDTYGHKAGDEVLSTIAHRMKLGLRENDCPSRFGGDEFVVLAESVDSLEHAMKLKQKLESLITLPIAVEGRSLVVSASIGVALFPDKADSYESLIQASDTDMYIEKNRIG